MSMATKTIVIAGGGFADTTLARCLAQPQGPHIDRVDVGHVFPTTSRTCASRSSDLDSDAAAQPQTALNGSDL